MNVFRSIVFIALAFVVSSVAHALPLVLSIDSVIVPQTTTASTASVELFLSSGTNGSPAVAAHQLQLSLLAGSSGIRFQDAKLPEVRPYLGPSGAPTSRISLSGLVLDSGDITFGSGITPFANAGLVQATIAIPANTPVGSYPLVLNTSDQLTFFASESGNHIPLSLNSGVLRILLPGDYDRDDDVDGSDYLVWQRSYGMVGPSKADGNWDGTVDAADYAVWRDNFGASAASQAIVAQHIPEPSSAMMFLVGGVLVASRNCSRAH